MSLLTKRKPGPKANTAPVVTTQTLPAPVRGLNFKDSLAEMQPGDALQLDNILCRAGYVEVRKGWAATATGFAAAVETIMPYTSITGTSQRFAAAGAGIYDATASGAIGAAVVAGLTSAYWNHTQVSNVAGNYLICLNGVDNARIYDGAVWAALGVAGVPINTLTQCAVWKRRLWFVEKNKMQAWYLATDAIAGAATAFPMNGIFKRGGKLLSILNWTIDGGSGSDDYLLFVTSMGEVAVYKGTDPSAAATFALVGVYYVGAPVGERYWAQYGGDVLMLTAEGLIPFSKYLQSQTVDRSTFLSDSIQQLVSADISLYGATQGWEVHVFFDDNFLIIQVPAGAIGARYQYVMSTITGAWSKFLVSPAITWCVQGASLYHGQSTQVANAWTGYLDGTQAIQYNILPAFSDFGSPTVQKLFTLGRVTIQSDLVPAVSSLMLVDYNQEYMLPSGAAPAAIGALWDSAVWDSAAWGATSTVYRNWLSLNALGYVGAVALQGYSASAILRIIALDYSYQTGGLL
jgi:hypothetical protein